MSSKKKMTAEPFAENGAVAAEKNSVKEDNAEADAISAGFCVYIGPTIIGQIQNGTVYQGSREQVLMTTDMARAVEKYPLIAGMLVDGSRLPEARLMVKKPGNLLYINYHKLAKAVK